MELLVTLFGVVEQVGAGQMCARALVVFFLTLVAVRIAGRRAFGQRTPFDMVVAILLGAIASRAVVGASSFLGTMGACFVIVLLHRVLGWVSVRYDALDALINGKERTVASQGRPDRAQMERGLITPRDLAETARLHGKPALTPRSTVVLERSGEMSLVEAPPEEPPPS